MTREKKIAVAVLAAGQATRLKSSKPKVLHTLSGKSLVHRVLDSIKSLEVARTFVIVGVRADEVKTALEDCEDIQFVHQTGQLGTGHAIQQVVSLLEGFDGDLLVLNGEIPLLRAETLRAIIESHQTKEAAATVLTARVPDPTGYDRVFCDESDQIEQIVGHRDCTPAQRENSRINAGVYCFHSPDLAKAKLKLRTESKQGGHYLPDVVSYMNPVAAHDVIDYKETFSINDHKQLARAFKILQTRQKDRWMARGVTFLDPDSVTIDETVELGEDVVIEPQTHLRGNTKIGDGCCIGPGTLIENSQIGDGCKARFSVITDSVVANNTWVGPYAHLRANAQLGEGCRVGNFVEIKNATLGNSTFAAHLSYVGDAEVGNNVNIGAGTITANFDGFKKHKTVIHDGAKTGSNSVLVAPITIGSRVTIGAGSIITDDVQDNALVIARARQVVKSDWKPKPK